MFDEVPMKWTLWFGCILARWVPAENLVDLGVEVWLQMQKSAPHEKKVRLLTQAAEKNLGLFLADLSRAERAALMNGLLPLVIHEFPLADLDLLAAFPSRDECEQEEASTIDPESIHPSWVEF